MRKTAIIALLIVPLALSGCLAQTAVGIVSAPVKIASQTADWATTSQDEADRNYGRKMRKADARDARERKAAERRCRHDRDACDDGYRNGDY
ncbi:hypothetical protein [Sphingomonas sp. 28-63-12]|uniref:hypothetical protein n=1 Tax=Sphingomonas sp. 28-63-12 TaxID=1970434 RepID=UPI000BDCD102|nr:MAG: hypothetical protein B7Y47_11855 [Sphingomonas sp. 28-63-12]